MNIIKLSGDNNGGNKYILVFDAAGIVSAGERPEGHYVNAAICHYSAYPAVYIEGSRDSIDFNEEDNGTDGVPFYNQVASCIIPKYRADVMQQLINFDKKRVVALVPDRNGKTRMIGTREEPALFVINRSSTKSEYGQRNEIEISISAGRRDPAYNYTPTTVQVSGVGTVTIGKRVFTA